MAIADMFLKVAGVTGECEDSQHKGEILVVSWSWGVHGGKLESFTGGGPRGVPTIDELEVVKKADLSTPTLINYLLTNKVIKSVRLTVRKAGKVPLEYLTIDLDNARLTSVRTGSQNTEIVEHVNFAFAKVSVTYTPQDSTGGPGAANTISYDLTVK